MKILNLSAATAIAFSLAAATLVCHAADTPTYRPMPSNVPPVYRPQTVPPASATTSQNACAPFQRLLSMAQTGRQSAGGQVLSSDKSKVLNFTDPLLGAQGCRAYAGSVLGTFSASCKNTLSDPASAVQMMKERVAVAEGCLPGWKKFGGKFGTGFERADHSMTLTITVPDTEFYDPMVETTAHYEDQPGAAAKAANCETMEKMQALTARNLAAVPTIKVGTATIMQTPLAGANICVPLSKASGRDKAALMCKWRVEPTNAQGPDAEAVGSVIFEKWVELTGTCRAGQRRMTPTKATGADVAALYISGDQESNERWSITLRKPNDLVPWSVEVISVMREVGP